jgi:hypothetical protein
VGVFVRFVLNQYELVPIIVMSAIITHSIQVVIEHVPGLRAEPVVRQHSSDAGDYLIQLRLVVFAFGQLALQFGDLLFGANDPVFIGSGKCTRLNVIQVHPDSFEQAHSPVVSGEKPLASVMPAIIVVILRRRLARPE